VTTLVERAAAFATARHNAIDHRRRYSGAPYTDHLQEVASILATHRRPEIEVAAAWLHDVVEDTPTTIEEVEAEFGKEVPTVVAELTDPEEGNRATRKMLAAKRLANASAHGQKVKCADIRLRMLTARELYRARAFPSTTSSTERPMGSRCRRTLRSACAEPADREGTGQSERGRGSGCRRPARRRRLMATPLPTVLTVRALCPILVVSHQFSPRTKGARIMGVVSRNIVMETWAGRRYYAVEVIGETPKKARVRILAPGGVMLPKRRYVKCGEIVLVPKHALSEVSEGASGTSPGSRRIASMQEVDG